jgi:prepilin-type processing-associated H-X9-DG protein
MHNGGVNVLFADGSGHFIANSVSIDTWRALGSRNGGEALGDY